MALLPASGHALEVRDLGGEPWTAGQLRTLFDDRPVAVWATPDNECYRRRTAGPRPAST